MILISLVHNFSWLFCPSDFHRLHEVQTLDLLPQSLLYHNDSSEASKPSMSPQYHVSVQQHHNGGQLLSPYSSPNTNPQDSSLDLSGILAQLHHDSFALMKKAFFFFNEVSKATKQSILCLLLIILLPMCVMDKCYQFLQIFLPISSMQFVHKTFFFPLAPLQDINIPQIIQLLRQAAGKSKGVK